MRKCPICASKKVHRKGKRNGKQRYRCSDCFNNFSGDNKGVQHSNQFIWVRKWIMERQVHQYLSRGSGMFQSKIQRLFKQYSKKAPLVPIRSKNHVHLLVGGSYFTNGLYLILYYDYDIQYVQLCRETSNEKLKEIKEDLKNFKRLGVDVYSVTCDSHSVILQAVEKTDPNAVIQRCLVHIRCQVQNYLSRKSKLDLHKWHEKNRHFVNEKTINEQSERWWYKHKNLHLATTHLIKAIRVMLIQLPGENISIPSFLYS